MIVYLLVKIGIEPEDAQAFFKDLLSTPAEKRMARAVTLLNALFGRYRRCDLPDGTVRWERVSRERRP